MQPWGASAGPAATKDTCDLHEGLRRASRGEVGVYAAFQTLAQAQEEQARAAADLLEDETWALTLIIGASEAIWRLLPGQTLRFALDTPTRAEGASLELGRFAHLAALDAPSSEEHTLIAAPTPCVARAEPHKERQAAGYSGALACSYVPIPLGEAIAALGFARIVAEIEAATRTAGHALLLEATAQRERRQQLLRIERMLDWEPDAGADPAVVALPVNTRLAMMLVGQGHRCWLAAGALSLGVVAVLCGCLLTTLPLFVALLVVDVGLVTWQVTTKGRRSR